MLAWIVFFVLLIVEVVGIAWWLRKEYYPVFFNGWAAFIYSLIIAADCLIAWLVSWLERPGGTLGTGILAVLGVILAVITILMTLFFRWAVRQDILEPPEDS